MESELSLKSGSGPLARTPKPVKKEKAGIGWNAETGWLAAALLPGLFTVYLGFRAGGFYLGATSLAAAEMALILGVRFVVARRPLQGVSPALIVAVVAMALLGVWTLLSADWSDSVSRAFPAYTRVLLCGLVLAFFGSMPFDVRRVKWMLYGVATAIVIICGAALTARLLPHTILDTALITESRLGYPLTYWNTLGIIACVGTVLCAHLACSTRDHPVARILGAAAVPALILTLYYTLSRGGIWAAPAALVVYALIGRPRALLSGAIAIVPATAVILMVASPSSSVTEGYPFHMVAEGKHVALVLGACILGAAVLRACLLPLDGWLDRVRLPERAREPVIVLSIIAGLVLVVGGAAAANVPHVVSNKYHEFTDRTNTGPASRGEGRLLSARPEGRFELWDVALDAYRENRFHGTGAGTFALDWERDRETDKHVENAHSLYLETLGELGVVGLALLVIAIGLILGAFAFRARGPDRALFAALLAAGVAWAIHAGVDWDWQMPAVTIWFFAFGGAALARSLRWRRRQRSSELKRTLIRAGGAIICIAIAIVPARLALSQARLDSAIDATGRGDCRTAQSDANSSLSVVSQRPTPYLVLAFCDMQIGRYGTAAVALERARQRDPDNWVDYYDLAVARAGAGLDPRKAAARAAILNPEESLARSAPFRFQGHNKNEWEQAAKTAPILPPTQGEP